MGFFNLFNKKKTVENANETPVNNQMNDFAEEEIPEEICDETLELPDLKSEGDFVQEFYFYRKMNSHKFNIFFNEQLVRFVVRDSTAKRMKMPYSNTRYYYIKSYGENYVEYQDNIKLKGYVVEIPRRKPYKKEGVEQEKIIWGKKNVPPRYRTLSKTLCDFEEEYDRYCAKKNAIETEAFRYDSTGVLKNYYGARLSLNWTKMIFDFELYFGIGDNYRFEDKKRYIRFSFETGRFYSLSDFDFYWSDEKFDKNFIPSEIFSFVKQKVLAMRNVWAKKKLSEDIFFTGFDFLKAVVKYPFEPNLFTVADSDSALDFTNGKFLDRNRSDCFNEFCRMINIQSYTSLRKSFSGNPKSLLAYKYLCDSELKDKNIINRFLESKDLVNLIVDSKDKFVRFAKYVVQEKNEIKLLNIFTKQKNYYVEDCLRMLNQYWEKVPDELKKDIMDDGFTRYNHDLLSKIYYTQDRENVRFNYRLSQKRFQMKIDGFVFKLPEDVETLTKIGGQLHNCVASYATKIENNSCTIVYAEKEGEPKICIEIRNNSVVQARGSHNELPSGESKKVFGKWAAKNKLDLVSV